MYDEEGEAYLDLYGGHAVISIGHGHPHFVKRVGDQLAQLPFYSNSVQNPLQVELARKLGALSGCGDYQLFLCNSGAEANENALKLASFQTGKSKVIAFERAFHGRTSAAVNATDNPKIKAPINTTFPVDFHAWNQTATVAAGLEQGDVCAVIVEGIQGIGGIHPAEAGFLRSLQTLCRAHGALLILDEIQSGYGRSGDFFAFQAAGIEPDLITVAKGMGNGFPVGGVLIHPRIQASYGLLGTTFGGNHLACAAALSVLEVMEGEDLMANSRTVGDYLEKALRRLPGIKEVRGRGLILAAEFTFPVAPLRKHLLYREKVFTGSASDPYTLRLLPPLCLSLEEAGLFIEKLTHALTTNAKLQEI